jgi:two-component system, OmpR family, KDP operon response regulator KdpE
MDDEGALILVVDDEPALLRTLTVALEARGFRVAAARSGRAALEQASSIHPAAVVLDLGLPDLDGLDVLRRIRTWSQVPVVVLTAEGAEDRKVVALDDGADDYVTKPFSTPELLARLRVALRHHRDDDTEPSVITEGPLCVDLPRRRVTMRGEQVELTPTEFNLLAVLARHAGRVLTHQTLLREVWGPEYGTETHYLRVYVGQLRKKLGDDPARPLLVTEPGVGYRLADGPEDDLGPSDQRVMPKRSRP